MTSSPVATDHSVALVGAGGNIGSHALAHLARTPSIARLTLVDPDKYETSNLMAQDITPADLGRNKAAVQGRRARRVRPGLVVTVHAERVERLPLGALRADVIACCVDSRSSRQAVNEMAWRLGVPWVDAGVSTDGLLARVNVYVPGLDAPCYECAFDERDYANLEQVYPCDIGTGLEPGVGHHAGTDDGEGMADATGVTAGAPATNAPSSLGGLAASLQVIEIQKLLAGRAEQALIGRQVVVSAAHHSHVVTAFRRLPACLRADHDVWRIERLDGPTDELTLGDLLGTSGTGHTTLGVAGHAFVRRLRCRRCGWTRRLLRLESALSRRQRRCRRCAGDHPRGFAPEMIPVGDDLIETLDATRLPPLALELSLARLGLRTGDVLTLSGAAKDDIHREIAGSPATVRAAYRRSRNEVDPR